MKGQLHAPAALSTGNEARVPIAWEAGWAPRVGLDAVEKRKILHCRESNPGLQARSPSLYQLNFLRKCKFTSRNVAQAETFLTCNREVSVSNLGRDGDCSEDFFKSLRQIHRTLK
jgi:hypothetical protein